MNILEIENLKVNIGKFTLQIAELFIEKGELFHIKGSNGSGKTVFLNTVLGFMKYTGKLNIHSKSINGFINNDTLIPYLYPKEYLKFIEKLKVDKNYFEKCKSILMSLDYDINEKKYIRNLSEGSKNKIGIASILSLESDIMIFDEPFANLDDKSCKVLSNIFENERNKSTIIYSSHQDMLLKETSYLLH